MNVIINGKNETLKSGMTVLDLIAAKGLEGRRLALELNGEILPKSTFAEHEIKAGDTIEIVHAVGGG